MTVHRSLTSKMYQYSRLGLKKNKCLRAATLVLCCSVVLSLIFWGLYPLTGRMTRTKWVNPLSIKIKCDNKMLQPRTYQRGSFWVLENHVPAGHGNIKCYESVTYVTHVDFLFLDHLVPLLTRWQAPVSISVYAPGTDYQRSMEKIFFLRECLESVSNRELIKKFATFHMFFESAHFPKKVLQSIEDISIDCKTFILPNITYKSEKNLDYPINIARNVARNPSLTHFVLISDIELYPSDNLVPAFLDMIAKEERQILNPRRVFPLAVYEVEAGYMNPRTKTELIYMLCRREVVRFHLQICARCHHIPDASQWEEEPESTEMKVFSTAKRTGLYERWEPFFIGSMDDPPYDERLTWSGKGDKMPHAYILCVLDYDFSILNNAFLTHSPGVKSESARLKEDLINSVMVMEDLISPDLEILYGKREGCVL